MLRLSRTRIIYVNTAKSLNSSTLKAYPTQVSKFSTSQYSNEGAIKKAAEKAADKANHLAGDALLKGIEVGETVAGVAKKAADATTSGLNLSAEEVKKGKEKLNDYKEEKKDDVKGFKKDLEEKSDEVKDSTKKKWESAKDQFEQ